MNNFSARRIQMFFDGTVYKDFGFKIFMDYSGSNFLLLDSYLDWNFLPELSLRVGKFKVPTNLERLQASSRQQFIEPGFSSSLLPNRDVGIQLSGLLLGGVFEYQLAAFNGVQDGNSGMDDNNDDKDLWGRVFMKIGGFGVGSSFGRGWHDNSALPSYKTPNRSTTMFSYRPASTGSNTSPAVVSKGYVGHFNPQISYYGKGLSLNGDYVKSTHSVEKVGFGNLKMNHSSWQLTTAYILTVEEQSYKGFKVKNPIHKNGIGAIEVLGRIGGIQFDKSDTSNVWVDSKSVHSVFGWTVGANWYLNDAVRFQLNYENNQFSGGSSKPEEKIVSLSTNLSF